MPPEIPESDLEIVFKHAWQIFVLCLLSNTVPSVLNADNQVTAMFRSTPDRPDLMQELSGLIAARPTISPFINRVVGPVTRSAFLRLIGVYIAFRH